MDNLSKLQDIFRDIFDNEEIALKRETSPDDIEDWDSLAQVNIVVACEDEFGVKFDLNDIAGIRNAGDILDVIEARRG